MTADFTIKRGDTAPPLAATLRQSGAPFDLSTANGVQFHMRRKGQDEAKVDAAASITSPVDGEVQYQWTSGDTDTVGTYEAEFEVELGSGALETFPGDKFLLVEVVDDIA